MLDVSEPLESVMIKLASCRETLDELQVDSRKVLLVLNKVDLLKGRLPDDFMNDPLFKDFSTARVSATRGDGLRQLRNKILERTFPPKSKISPEARPAGAPKSPEVKLPADA